jgi:hypothetical protein
MPIHSLHLLGFDVRTWTLVGELPFLGFIVALYLGGRRQGWAWRPALLATAAFVAGLGVGTGVLPSVLGAVGGGIALWLLAQKVLGLKQPPIAVLALGLVALIAIGRWGCLVNGCCFGTITDLPWGVHYGAGSAPHFLHQSLGLLAGSPQSISVHPYPAYESLGLLLWLPFAYWLSRRLRSKGSLLAFSAAFDLALRGLIDGTRAMINVWWSVLGFWQGLNLFQWVLLAAACCFLLLGVLFELRARRLPSVAPEAAASVSPSRLWLVYLGLLLLGWSSDAGQTTFLHRALLLALAACVPALAMPRGLGASLRARPAFGYAIAGVLVLVLGIRLETRAHATLTDGEATVAHANSSQHRRWLYDVDQRRGVMIRVGGVGDDDSVLYRREDMLGLPRLAVRSRFALQDSDPPADSTTDPTSDSTSTEVAPARRSHTWVGAGLYRGFYSQSKEDKYANSNSSDSSCSNSYTTTTTHQRTVIGGWGRVEEEIPHGSSGVFWIGGRAGLSHESQLDQVESTDPAVHETTTSASYSAYFLNLWGEYETPGFALGLAALGKRSPEQGITLYPGFHLRAGSPRFGFDAGFADRLSFLSEQSGHIGFSAAIRRGDTVRFPNDLKARLFFGMFFFPGTDIHRFDFAPGVGGELFVSPRTVFGFNAAIYLNQVFAGLHVRTVVGP